MRKEMMQLLDVALFDIAAPRISIRTSRAPPLWTKSVIGVDAFRWGSSRRFLKDNREKLGFWHLGASVSTGAMR
jgi:hypothetical protein